METREWHNQDKSKLPEGPWQHEPDKVQYTDQETGLPCLIVRNHSGMGNLCGYVGVPEGHPLFGKNYDDAYEAAGGYDGIQVHGGLTFAGPCNPHAKESEGICHIPGNGESDNVWWLGFDCAHAFDLVPSMLNIMGRVYENHPELKAMDEKFQAEGSWYPKDVYRDIDYVKSEIKALAKQIAAVKG